MARSRLTVFSVQNLGSGRRQTTLWGACPRCPVSAWQSRKDTMSMQARSTKVRRGVAVMEFTLSLLFLIPLLLGVLIFGFKLIRSLEMTQVTRDLGAMYLRGVDFRNA